MVVHGDPSASLPQMLIVMVVLLVLDLAVAMYFLQDLYRPERRVAGGDKTFWAVIILLGSIVGWIAYLYFGRENE
jgi:hypothetical protein